jgi:flagellar motor component MotA
VLLILRILFAIIGHIVLWLGIAVTGGRFFLFFTSWGVIFTALSFTLLVSSHIKEIRERSRYDSSR